MPIPLIPVIIVAAVIIGVGGTIATRRIAKRLDGKRVAVLGGRRVGKSSLIRYLSTGDVATDPAEGNPGDAEESAAFGLKIGKKRAEFVVPRDLPGADGLGLPKWREAFSAADLVWYLFRADLIVQGDAKEIGEVRKHLEAMNGWRADMRSKGPKIVLIGTWADELPEWRDDPRGSLDSVRSAEPLKFGAVKLGHAPVIVGGLGSVEDAEKLVKSLANNL